MLSLSISQISDLEPPDVLGVLGKKDEMVSKEVMRIGLINRKLWAHLRAAWPISNHIGPVVGRLILMLGRNGPVVLGQIRSSLAPVRQYETSRVGPIVGLDNRCGPEQLDRMGCFSNGSVQCSSRNKWVCVCVG
ncbi:hypothetical protein E3N88_38816 [Mikania micrantha]|uniref:Uncharacterized protein n=1 Tax=Mikania micrantha TaxID=192012 RepID=A0A5N6LV26_9ASTR|nr:hypothetical protein E3N88_38816 [Mikania micrantha]